MNLTETLPLNAIEHRGCGIRAESYEIEPQSWLPEACVWLQNEAGFLRLWVRSFAHCFDAEKLTFGNKQDADSWATLAAQKIIDRALEQPELGIVPATAKPRKLFPRVWKLARHPLLALARIKQQ